MDASDFNDLEQRRRAQILTVFSFFILGFLGIFMIIDLVIERYLITAVLSLMLVLTAVNYLLMKRSGNLERASTFVLVPYLAFTWMIFTEGGIEGTGPFWSYFVPVFAFYLKGSARGLAFVGLHSAVILGIFLGSVAGWYPQVYSGLYFLIFFVSLIAISSFLLIFENVRQQYAESARSASSSLIKANRELQLLSTRDLLTGANNRRNITAILEKEMQRAQRYECQLSAMLADLDNFKNINDNFGHDFGDHVLREFTNGTQAGLRITDSLGRFGGEEFLIILPDTGPSAAAFVAERIRQIVEDIRIDGGDGKSVSPTVSLGVGSFDGNESLEEFLKRLDRALYRAKDNGRNRVETAD
jgi:diguanylate cyclase (GGDEF)-like protein